MNVTLSGLAILLSLGQSPTLVPMRRQSTTIMNSVLSRFGHPLVSSTVPHNIRMSGVRVSMSLSSVVECTTFPDVWTTYALAGCYSESSSTFVGKATALQFLKGEVEIVDCTFVNCTGDNVLSMSGTAFVVNNTKVITCNGFLLASDTVVNSTIESTTFNGVGSSAVKADSSTIVLRGCSFTGNFEAGSLMQFEKSAQTSLIECKFDVNCEGSESLVSFTEVSVVFIDTCDFIRGVKVELEESYAIVRNCCFVGSIADIIEVTGNNRYEPSIGIDSHDNVEECPWKAATVATPVGEEIFAIVSTVFFFTGFAVLFISMMTYAFCRNEAEVPVQYPALYCPIDDDDNDVPSD